MESRPGRPGSALFEWPLDLGRAAVGALLGLGAAAFLLHGRHAFAAFHRPDGARVGLALCEIAGAVLFVFRATELAGAAVLLAVLGWALGFHFALALDTRLLWIDLAAVALLAAAGRVRRRPGAA